MGKQTHMWMMKKKLNCIQNNDNKIIGTNKIIIRRSKKKKNKKTKSVSFFAFLFSESFTKNWFRTKLTRKLHDLPGR